MSSRGYPAEEVDERGSGRPDSRGPRGQRTQAREVSAGVVLPGGQPLSQASATLGLLGRAVLLLVGVAREVVELLAPPGRVVDVLPIAFPDPQQVVLVGRVEVGAGRTRGVEKAAALPGGGRRPAHQFGTRRVDVHVAAYRGGPLGPRVEPRIRDHERHAYRFLVEPEAVA